MNDKPSKYETASYWVDRYVELAVPGVRNKTGVTLACQLRDNGIAYDDAKRAMLDYQRRVPQPPGKERYSEREARSTVRTIYDTPARDPVNPDYAPPSSKPGSPSPSEAEGSSRFEAFLGVLFEHAGDLGGAPAMNELGQAFHETMESTRHKRLKGKPTERVLKALSAAYADQDDALFDHAASLLRDRLIPLLRIMRTYAARHRAEFEALCRSDLQDVPGDLFERVGIDYDTLRSVPSMKKTQGQGASPASPKRQREAPPPQREACGSETITQDDALRLWDVAQQHGYDEETLRRLIQQHGFERPSRITKQALPDLLRDAHDPDKADLLDPMAGVQETFYDTEKDQKGQT